MSPQQRQELAELLARLVMDGEITEEQATALYLAVMDDGTIADEALPLPPYIGIAEQQPPDDDDILKILAVMTGLSVIALRNIGDTQRTNAADTLQDWHTAEAGALADLLGDRRISVAEFQRRLRELNNQHNAAQIALGAGDKRGQMAASAAQQAALQAAYLQRFADEAAGRLIAEAAGLPGSRPPFSAAYLAERAAQYGGIGRALYFQSYEALGIQHLGDGSAPGIVVRYVARDDARTCSPCHRAQGYYLPGQGPYPGQICVGRHHCRCRRIVVYDPVKYFELIGGTAPTP